jgi:hypothetical protein
MAFIMEISSGISELLTRAIDFLRNLQRWSGNKESYFFAVEF